MWKKGVTRMWFITEEKMVTNGEHLCVGMAKARIRGPWSNIGQDLGLTLIPCQAAGNPSLPCMCVAHMSQAGLAGTATDRPPWPCLPETSQSRLVCHWVGRPAWQFAFCAKCMWLHCSLVLGQLPVSCEGLCGFICYITLCRGLLQLRTDPNS